MTENPVSHQVQLDIAQLRRQFPLLQRQYRNRPLVFLDGPAGTQVPESVIEAGANYYRQSNANLHGLFVTSQESDALVDQFRQKMAHFLGAPSPHCISYGSNMTTLNFSLSKAVGRALQTGDEILISQLDHEANRGPWLALREKGIVVREIRLQNNGELDYQDFEEKINERTRLVALGFASNIFGTVNELAKVRQLTHQYNAWMLVDAVHAAPHFTLDVQALDCDFLLCSVYKFYGPHVGVLYAKPGLLDRLQPDCLRTQYQTAPYRLETGTFNHAALAGSVAAIDFIADLGNGETERQRLLSAMQAIQGREREVILKLYEGLQQLPGVEVVGPNFDSIMRSPTLAFTVKNKSPLEVCQYFSDRNICAWAGHFYAIRAIEVLGLSAKGGVTRVGVNVYNTEEEIAYTLEVLQEMLG
ncbi:MAG: cysteine desulfurase-like protein [Bacteroidota bacterium]